MWRTAILTTGGTIEKSYDEAEGTLNNVQPLLDEMLDRLRLPTLETRHFPVMSKDSLDMTEQDRDTILHTVIACLPNSDAIVIVHGTDTLAQTGEYLHGLLPDPLVPIILTGAMRPFGFRRSDALQNLTEALLATRVVAPGIYVAMHNQVLKFPGVIKDRERLTFVRSDSTA